MPNNPLSLSPARKLFDSGYWRINTPSYPFILVQTSSLTKPFNMTLCLEWTDKTLCLIRPMAEREFCRRAALRRSSVCVCSPLSRFMPTVSPSIQDQVSCLTKLFNMTLVLNGQVSRLVELANGGANTDFPEPEGRRGINPSALLDLTLSLYFSFFF